jgi:hypothetical protein
VFVLPRNDEHDDANELDFERARKLALEAGSGVHGMAGAIRDICLQLKDPVRNGGRTLSKIQEHMATDSLVGWAWSPGEGRSPAPGTQVQFGALIEAWIATGAECPQL